jgi:hypothetical protein
MNGLSVVSVTGAHHAILLVSDLDGTELAKLSTAVSVPLARRLEASLLRAHGVFASLQFERPFQLLTSNSDDWLGSEKAFYPER